MKIINVDLGDRSYPIFIGECLSDPLLLTDHVKNKEIVIVTNETIAPLYLDNLVSHFQKSDRNVLTVILPDGEQYKTLDTVNTIYNSLLENNVSRKVGLIALGGGVVGDMTGFAAASYQRGVDFYQIPTTLLSQVDSSVGGKTGVNHSLGKNMIGAFKQPIAVFIDPKSLKTLPRKEFIAGFAEVIKHGVIQDEKYLDYLEANIDAIYSLDEVAVGSVISRSCEIKSSVVTKDETEQGLRAILNYGHTFGHAIETTMGYGEWLHGEAVGAGMVMAADLSHMLGYISEVQFNRIHTLIQKSGLPVSPPTSMTIENFLTAMARDKKVDAGNLKFVLIRSVGDGFVSGDVTITDLKLLLSKYCQS